MKTYTFQSTTLVNAPLDKVFDFFSKAENLQTITPPWLNFKILTPTPIEMKVGQLIDYRLKLYGILVKWQTEITVWDPPLRFVDRQLKGPYKVWEHEHRFEETGEGVRITDTVNYQVPGWILAPLIRRFFVKRDVEKIFAHRERVIRDVFTD